MPILNQVVSNLSYFDLDVIIRVTTHQSNQPLDAYQLMSGLIEQPINTDYVFIISSNGHILNVLADYIPVDIEIFKKELQKYDKGFISNFVNFN